MHNEAEVSFSISDGQIDPGGLIPGKQGTGSEVCWVQLSPAGRDCDDVDDGPGCLCAQGSIPIARGPLVLKFHGKRQRSFCVAPQYFV